MYQQEIRQLLNQIAWIDDITYYHSLRVGYLMAKFVETQDGKTFLKQAWVTRNEAVVAALLHDIGKTLWPPDVLLTSTSLKDMTRDELKEMWTYLIEHPLSSKELVLKYYEKTGNRYWERIAQGVGAHHENYGGGGYPHNLRGQDIPLLSRGLKVFDDYTLFTAVKRDQGLPHEASEALKLMSMSLGCRYDPYWGNIIIEFLREDQPTRDLEGWLESELTQNL